MAEYVVVILAEEQRRGYRYPWLGSIPGVDSGIVPQYEPLIPFPYQLRRASSGDQEGAKLSPLGPPAVEALRVGVQIRSSSDEEWGAQGCEVVSTARAGCSINA